MRPPGGGLDEPVGDAVGEVVGEVVGRELGDGLVDRLGEALGEVVGDADWPFVVHAWPVRLNEAGGAFAPL